MQHAVKSPRDCRGLTDATLASAARIWAVVRRNRYLGCFASARLAVIGLSVVPAQTGLVVRETRVVPNIDQHAVYTISSQITKRRQHIISSHSLLRLVRVALITLLLHADPQPSVFREAHVFLFHLLVGALPELVGPLVDAIANVCAYADHD